MGDEENPNARLLAFSDGVIAVAITLLVLDIKLPEGFGADSDQQLWDALVELGPRLLAYFLSFAVIGSFWISHRAKFNHIVRSNVGLLWINMIFLLTIGLVPFTTNLIAESGGALSTAIYALTMVISGLSISWIWAHAVHSKLIDPEMKAADIRRQTYTSLLVAAVFAVSIPLAFAHSDLAKYFWLLIIPVNFVRRSLSAARAKREPAKDEHPAG